MNYYFIPPILAFIGIQVSNTLNNEFVQLGFLGLLLSILIWYSRNAYRENIKREVLQERDKQVIIERYEKALKEHDERYHELHLEILVLLKMKIDDKQNIK